MVSIYLAIAVKVEVEYDRRGEAGVTRRRRTPAGEPKVEQKGG